MATIDLVQNELKWLGSPVHCFSGSIEEVRMHIPEYERRPFATKVDLDLPGEMPGNEFLDMIVRKPTKDSENEIPVGVVSKNYQLVQHIEVFDRTVDAMTEVGIEMAKVSAELSIPNRTSR